VADKVQEDELSDRTMELLSNNGTQVLSLLVQYAQSSGVYYQATANPLC